MKKFIFIAILALFISPILASASWWNPFTWGKKSAPIVQQMEVQSSVEDVYVPEPVIVEEVTEEVTEKVAEKIIEKPIIKTQTITVQDPALQIKIDALVAENNALKAQITKLQLSNKLLLQGLNIVENTPTVDEDCRDSKEKVVALNKQLAEIQAKYLAEITLIQSNPNGTFGGALAQEVNALNQREVTETNAQYSKISTAQAEVQLYCN